MERLWVLVTQLPPHARMWQVFQPPRKVPKTDVKKIASFFGIGSK